LRVKLKSLAKAKSGGSGQKLGAVEALRDSWSRYPDDWKQSDDLNLGFSTLGEEWGGPDFADLVVEELAGPYLGADIDVLELGCGGGKFSQRIALRCRSLVCSDIAQAMLDHARRELDRQGAGGNVSYTALNGIDFSGVASDSVDFVFSYDVQLHLQPQNIFSYLLDARRILRKGGVFMLHQVDLAKLGGINTFLNQYSSDTWKRDFDHPLRRGHIYYMSEDQMRALADAAGLRVDRMVVGFPSVDSPLHKVTEGRDIVGFFSAKPGRLDDLDPAATRLIRVEDGPTVYVVLDGRPMAIGSALQFERAGFAWDDVEPVSQGAFDAMPAAEALLSWE
jgi:SAM-dependent methyltransferase